MTLIDLYLKTKSKLYLDGSPWYTRWFWWLGAIATGIWVVVIWSVLKNNEAKKETTHRLRHAIAEKARVDAFRERDQLQAFALKAKADRLAADALIAANEVVKSAERAKEYQFAITKADSWAEIAKIEKELR